MTLLRRIDTLGPPLLAAAALAVIVAPALAGPASSRMLGGHAPIRAASGPAALPTCRPGAQAGTGEVARLRGAAWYRLDPILDAAGGLDGQRLVVGRVGRRGGFELPLNVESFASGPSGGRILVGNDDGRRSVVRIIDVAGRCAAVVHEGRELIRRAVFDAMSAGIVEFRLDRATRADLGVWSRPADGAKPTRLLEPLVPNDRIGRVFATGLSWSTDGRLVVASCGEAACVTRILDRATGRVRTVDDHRMGEVIGLVGDDLVAYGGCPGLPCDIVAMDLRTGHVRGIATLAGLAAVSLTDRVGVVAFEDYAARGHLRVVRLDGTALRTLPLDKGLRLVPGSDRALAAVELPVGVIALAQRSRPSRALAPATFINVADGRRLPAAEVVP